MAEIRIQNPFLERLVEEQKTVTVILLNGYQLRGKIQAFDPYMIQIDSQWVYKHAISTIKED